jgi:hypothetical protein
MVSLTCRCGLRIPNLNYYQIGLTQPTVVGKAGKSLIRKKGWKEIYERNHHLFGTGVNTDCNPMEEQPVPTTHGLSPVS